jgi:3',5'-cyclic-nucleotide phosphodiesterase
MEKEVGMETALFGGPPELGNLLKLANGQINFMGIFASPLFDGVADLLPEMSFAANEIRRNKLLWQNLVDREKRKDSKVGGTCYDGVVSPRSQSPASPATRSVTETESRKGPEYFILTSTGSPAAVSSPSGLPQLDGGSENGMDPGMPSQDGSPDNRSHQSTVASSQDSPILAAAVNGSGQVEGTNLDTSTYDEDRVAGPLSSPYGNFRQGESRRCPSHRPFRMSARASVPSAWNRNSEAPSGIRTQSTSTYTNNTVMTPISSSTQASSVVSETGSDDRDYATQGFGLRIVSDPVINFEGSSGSNHDDREDEKAHAVYHDERHLRHVQENEKPSHFMATLIDKSFGNHHSNGITLTNPASSNSMNGCIPGRASRSSNPECSPSGDSTARTVRRRRSRLRLTFWRRNKPNHPSTINAMASDE